MVLSEDKHEYRVATEFQINWWYREWWLSRILPCGGPRMLLSPLNQKSNKCFCQFDKIECSLLRYIVCIEIRCTGIVLLGTQGLVNLVQSCRTYLVCLRYLYTQCASDKLAPTRKFLLLVGGCILLVATYQSALQLNFGVICDYS